MHDRSVFLVITIVIYVTVNPSPIWASTDITESPVRRILTSLSERDGADKNSSITTETTYYANTYDKLTEDEFNEGAMLIDVKKYMPQSDVKRFGNPHYIMDVKDNSYEEQLNPREDELGNTEVSTDDGNVRMETSTREVKK